MLTLNIEKHVIYFDDKNTAYTSFIFGLAKILYNKEEIEKNKDEEAKPREQDLNSFYFQVKIEQSYTYEWNSDVYFCEKVDKKIDFGSCPLSL